MIKDGLKLLLPLVLTIAVIAWVVFTIEGIFRAPVLLLVPQAYYFPGLGALIGFAILLVASILLQAWYLRVLHDKIIQWIQKIPVIKTIYNSFSQLFEMMGKKQKDRVGKPVLVNFGKQSLMGVLTREDASSLDGAIDEKDSVAVYLPMSYQIGGYTIIVSKKQITPMEMSTEDALGLIFMGGISKEER